jgi:ubiquinol-cytochrome c reductase cytochrome c1 subunit
MKRALFTLAVALLVGLVSTAQQVQAAGGVTVPMDVFPTARTKDLAALQNGARIFANHCLNCHSANLMRWNRLTQIGLDEKQIRDFLIFDPTRKVGDSMQISMQPADAKVWFGKAPPDLSVIVRARTSFDYKGTDYLFTLLRGYYRDASKPTGWNNIAYPNIGMPHVLWAQQGPREATITRVVHVEGDKSKGDKGHYERVVSVFDASGNVSMTRTKLEGHPGESVEAKFKPLDPDLARKFDEDVADLVAFLTFMTDPSGTTRTRIGVWVLVFLLFFTTAAWWLNRTYWRDIK